MFYVVRLRSLFNRLFIHSRPRSIWPVARLKRPGPRLARWSMCLALLRFGSVWVVGAPEAPRARDGQKRGRKGSRWRIVTKPLSGMLIHSREVRPISRKPRGQKQVGVGTPLEFFGG